MIRSLIRAGSRAGANLGAGAGAIRPNVWGRFYSEVNAAMDEYERKIFDILKQEFQPANLEVRDVSGGCGSMFAILVESEKFKGVPMIKQHRLVNDALKEEISKWHGLQLRTKAAN